MVTLILFHLCSASHVNIGKLFEVINNSKTGVSYALVKTLKKCIYGAYSQLTLPTLPSDHSCRICVASHRCM